MRIVAALGGNALLKRGEGLTAANQRANVKIAARALAPIIRDDHQLIITHGNGPQVGLLALQAASGPSDGDYPLDVLDAETEGMIGYMIEQELRNELPDGYMIATLLTQVSVGRHDPAFGSPTKPIGPVYNEAEAKQIATERGWRVAPDGKGWRRVVPSPEPIAILEMRVIEYLMQAQVAVICTGGGGIPVIERPDGSIIGVEAVIDKDRASALLARNLRADRLLLLTDVDAVYTNWGTPSAQAIASAQPGSFDLDDFAAGSMRPKVDAAIGFTNETGKPAYIGRLNEVDKILQGSAGTLISVAAGPTALRH
jgi:carbamate kinase